MIGFIHIPKNGGCAVKHWFKKNNLSLYSAHRHQRFDELNLRNADWWFAISRNPYQRIISYYEFSIKKSQKRVKKNIPNNEKDLYFKTINLYQKGFEEWVYNYQYIVPQFVWLQKNYVERCDKKIDQILKLEDINNEWKIIQNRTNVFLDLPIENKTQKTKKTYYNDLTQEYVYNLFKEDFEFFNYNQEL